MPPVPFAYGETAAAAFLYSYVPFLFLGFVFQFIARHLLYTTERVIVVGSFATSHHYCPMSVQPLSALTVTLAYRDTLFAQFHIRCSHFRRTKQRQYESSSQLCESQRRAKNACGYSCRNSLILANTVSTFIRSVIPVRSPTR